MTTITTQAERQAANVRIREKLSIHRRNVFAQHTALARTEDGE